jgi:signal transduction histidine kinase/ActR/RegA family two-component response regulator
LTVKQDDEDDLLRSVALQNAQTILLARQRAESELLRAKEALEAKTRELAHSLAQMRATLESTSNGILATDERRRIRTYNEKFVQLWDIPPEVIATMDHRWVLQHMSRRFADPQRFIARVEEIDESGTAEAFDILELADGHVLERFSKVQYVDNRNVGRVWSFSDITVRRHAEDAAREAADERKHLLESERNARADAERASAMKDEFLATLSHELRTPLSAILGWAQVLRLRTSNQEELRRGLEAIERNARVQAQLIEDLLDMSRINSGKLRLDIQPVDPVTFVEAALETVRPAAEAKAIRLEKRLEAATGPVSGDPHRLQQVVWNLLSNAIKFTPHEGTVTVELHRDDSHVELTVRDTGIGIRPEFLPYVFERFRQADATTTRMFGGLGLGLSIVRRLVELHGGTVRAMSAGEGQGSTFVARLPVAREYAIVGGRPVRAHFAPTTFDFEHADLAGLKVLVVEDEADARDLAQRVLSECHANVLTASTASEAIAAVEQEKPDVIVSDIGMPDVDGYELLRRIRALGPERGGRVPAIALTAFARTEDRMRALRAGFLVHVAKPVEPSELVATVASVAGRTGSVVV